MCYNMFLAVLALFTALFLTDDPGLTGHCLVQGDLCHCLSHHSVCVLCGVLSSLADTTEMVLYQGSLPYVQT